MRGDVGWLDGGTSGSPVDVTKCLDNSAFRLVCEVIEAGALVSFGTTSDGGALGITITVDGAWRREYVRDETEFELLMSEAAPEVIEAATQARASAAQRKRSRTARRP